MELRQGSEDSLTSATESELVAKVNKLSTVLLGTNSNVTVLNERLAEYHRSHEIALEEIRRSVSGSRLESGARSKKALVTSSPIKGKIHVFDDLDEEEPRPTGAHCCSRGDGVTNDSALVTLVSLLGEKDTSLSSLHKEVAFLRNELDQAKVQLQREADERARDKENAESFRNTVHAHLRKNISMVNRLIEHSANLPGSVKRALLSHSPQDDFVVQQAELSSKLEWLASQTPANEFNGQTPLQR